MDDFNIATITNAKNEYCITLINILTPLIIDGVKSIFKEALELCIENDEKNKYLMTFQNFLTRVPKWNQNIIDSETDRIKTISNCSYLEDLITCVHISQLKILTSIRVANKQKKINIEIPKVNSFIHNIYISYARKLYSNIYLFDITASSLQIQKNNRELEIICKECILNTIRESIPIEKILNSYIDEMNEDEEIITEVIKDDIDISKNNSNIKENNANAQENNVNAQENNVNSQENIIVEKENNANTQENNANTQDNIIVKKENNKQENDVYVQKNNTTNKNISSEKSENSNLSFNNNDTIIEFNNKDKIHEKLSLKNVNVPKTIDSLEKISEINHNKRKLEEEEEDDGYYSDNEDKLKIDMGSTPLNDIELDIETL